MSSRALMRPLVRLLRTAGQFVSGLSDAAVPNLCGVCGAAIRGRDGIVCRACRRSTTALLGVPYCGRCGRTLALSALHEDGCARCRTEQFWNVRGVARAGLYGGGLPKLIVDLKLRGVVRNAGYLGELLADAIRRQAWCGAIEALVPVPSHWLRRWQRSNEHTALLAAEVGRRLGVPVVRAVERIKAAPSQTTFHSKMRRIENVRGCFDAARPRRWALAAGDARLSIDGRTVCVIDNVLYTGATVCEVSKVCRRLRANAIYAAVVSRPPAADDPPVLPA